MDIYAEITDRIIAELEQDHIPWRKLWTSSGNYISHTTGKSYSLLNQMLLNRPGEYVTFKQIQQAGGHVRKGKKSHIAKLFCRSKTRGNTPYSYHYILFCHFRALA